MNLIRSMYALNATVDRPVIGSSDAHNRRASFHRQAMHNQNASNNGGHNSPQPSNHSEITTASSNSDSGIGFHNDFTNVSDRIVVVDFGATNGVNQRKPLPNLPMHPHKGRMSERPVPFGAESIRNIRSTIDAVPSTSSLPAKPQIFHAKSKSLDYTLHDTSRLTTDPAAMRAKPKAPAPVHLIRAMPDPPMQKSTNNVPLPSNCTSLPTSPIKYERYETIFGTDSDKTISDQATVQVCEIHTDEDDDDDDNDDHSHGIAPKIRARKFSSISTTRSCDDILMSVRDQEARKRQQAQMLASFDDVSLLGEAPPPPLPSRSKHTVTNDSDDYVFLAPQALPMAKKSRKKSKKAPGSVDKSNGALLDDFLSASIVYYKNRLTRSVGKENHNDNKVNQLPLASKTSNSKAKRRLSIDPKDNVCSIKNRDFSVWGSLQDLEMLNRLDINPDGPSTPTRDLLEPSYSEPDLLVSFFASLLHSYV